MARSPSDLAEALHAWMTEEMHIRPQGRHINSTIPTPQQLQAICRGQQMQDVWKFVLERVRSTQTVQTIKGNLTLKRREGLDAYKVQYQGDQRYSQERADLLAERKALIAQLASEETAASHVERDIERLRAEIATTATQYGEARDEIQTVNRKCALLNAHSGHVEEDVVRFNEYALRMRDKADARSRPSDKDQLYSRGGDKVELETACTRAVRESCGVIATFLHSLLQGRYSMDKALMYKEKEKLWQSIESNMAAFSSGHVVSSLELLAQTSALDLRDKTAKINILGDAEKLKFKYENGRLLDTVSSSTSKSLMQSVQQLVTERQGAHLQRFVETEKCRNTTWRLKERLSSVMELVEEALQGSCHGDAGTLELANSTLAIEIPTLPGLLCILDNYTLRLQVRTLFQTEVEIVSSRTALAVLDSVVNRLLVEVNEATKEKEALYNKYQKIQDFKKLAESKQNLIRVLVRQNVSARQRLDLQQEEIVKYIDSTLGNHACDTKVLTEQLTDSVKTEVAAFAKLNLPFLMYSLLNSGLRLTVLELSIHRLSIKLQPDTSGAAQPGDQHTILQRVLTALEFPPYKIVSSAPECLLPKVLELQQLVDDLEATLATQEALVRSIEGKDADDMTGGCGAAMPGGATRGGTANWERFQDLCRQVRSHDQKQVIALVPVLQQRLTHATQALTDCLRLRDTSTNWWEQPAQTGAGWVKVDGENLQQWRDKWTLAVTRLRQIQMGTS